MSYIGNTPVNQNFVAGADQFSGTGSQTAFTLSRNVNTVFDMFVTVSNVPQDPFTAYTVAGNTLTFDSAPPSGTNNIDVVYRATNVQTFVPTQGVSPSFGNLTYTGTLTGSTGVMNIGSGQIYKDASGNVGIGTSSPTNKLTAFSASATATVAKFGATNYGNLGTTYIEIGTQFGDGGSRIGNINPSGNLGTLVFETMTSSSGVYAERARIDSSGRLLVGTTTVNNGSLSNFNFNSFSNGIETTWTGTSSIYHVLVRNGNGFLGGINTSGSTTTYTNLSDYRVKENVQPMQNALSKVARLKPCTFTFKVDGKNSEGFIAHELQAVVPDAVVGEKDAVDAEGNPVYQGIDTSFLVATLTAAIQELKAELDATKAEIAALKGAA